MKGLRYRYFTTKILPIRKSLLVSQVKKKKEKEKIKNIFSQYESIKKTQISI
jgi:hypothetical protein